MDYSTWSSVMTVVMFAVFMGIVAWACSGRQRAAFEQASLIPFEEEGGSSLPGPPGASTPGVRTRTAECAS